MTEKIRVNFKAFDTDQLDKAVKEIVSIVKRSGAKVIGPVPLPTKTQRYTVLRSPHVNKKSREQFWIKTHKRLLFIEDSTAQTMDQLMKLEVSAGVQLDIKVN